MIYYARDKWAENEKRLKHAFEMIGTTYLQNTLDYKELIKMVVRYILNDGLRDDTGFDNYYFWDENNITIVDNGDYQGTLLFLIPKLVYQPGHSEYLMSYISYGSCSACDALQSAQTHDDRDELINELMFICRTIVTNLIKPYNMGWYDKKEFDQIRE